MTRARVAALLLVATLVAAACGGPAVGKQEVSGRFGDCNAVPKADCSGQQLASVDLSHADLRGIDLTNATLTGANLVSADLREAKLAGADLSKVDLSNADLRGADLSGAQLASAVLVGAELTGANLTGVRYCNTLLADGSLATGQCTTTTTSTPVRFTEPPVVVTFQPAKPTRCITKTAGTFVAVSYEVQRAIIVYLFLDGVRIKGTIATSDPRAEIPFPCDDRPHTLAIQGFSGIPPQADASFQLSLPPTAPR